MDVQINGRSRVLSLHAAAKRLQIPERTLRYRASRGRIPGAFKQGKLWKFHMPLWSTQDTGSSQKLRGDGIREDN
jgi:hypothetical protein